jgi:hypothetical protein
MRRVRSSMVLLGICVIALLIGGLRLATERTPLPVGSSYSAQPDGVLALYTWSAMLGGRPNRVQEIALTDAEVPAMVLVVQPEMPLDSTARDAFDVVAQNGGTLVVAGDSLPWLLYARSLGVTVEPLRSGASSASTPDSGITLPIVSRYRLRADAASPLLVTPGGDWVALRMPYRQGSLVVLASPGPLTNAALNAADGQTARFVYREVLPDAVRGRALAFDEAHHSFAPPTPAPTTLNQLLFETAPGRAVVYVALLVFVYLALSGRRLGPALPARPPAQTRRTMYEHVQMLANLYRRARQLAVARDAFGRHFARQLARGAGSSRGAAALASAVVRIESARSEAELIAAVAAAQTIAVQKDT